MESDPQVPLQELGWATVGMGVAAGGRVLVGITEVGVGAEVAVGTGRVGVGELASGVVVGSCGVMTGVEVGGMGVAVAAG